MSVVNDPDLAENTIEFVNKIGRSYAYTYPDRQDLNKKSNTYENFDPWNDR